MKETLKNLKKVYQYGKEYNKNLIIFTILSFAFVIVNVIYPIFTAKQITYLSTGLFKQLIIATLIVAGLELLRILRMLLIKRNTQVYFMGVFKNLQLAVSKEILKIKVKELDNNSSGIFIERINGDCSLLSHIFTTGCGQLTGIVSNIGIFIAIFIINKYLFCYYLF
jgi:ABC-type multidrug transport system fused ATPase/permease subunit